MPSRSENRRIVAVIVFAVESFSILQSITLPAIPTIQRSLHTSETTVTWVLSGYLLSAAIATPIGGRLGDSFGKRKALIFSLGLTAVGCVAAAVAPSIGVLIAARVVQGLGGSIVPLAFGILRDELATQELAPAISLTASTQAVGFCFGIVVSGPIASAFGFPALFLVPAVFALLGILAVRLLVPESSVRDPKPIPVLPALLLCLWPLILLIGLVKAPVWGWGAPLTLAAALATVVLMAAWYLAESRSAFPLIDLQLMRSRGMWSANLAALLLGITMYGILGFLPQFAQTPAADGFGFGVSAERAGYLLLPSGVMTLACGFLAPRISRLVGLRGATITGCLVDAAANFQAALYHSYQWQIALAGGLAGLGSGLAMASLANAVVASVPRTRTSMATGVNANVRTIGGSIGVAAFTGVLAATVSRSGHPTEHGYTSGFVLLGVAALVGCAASALMTASKTPVAPEMETRDEAVAGRAARRAAGRNGADGRAHSRGQRR